MVHQAPILQKEVNSFHTFFPGRKFLPLILENEEGSLFMLATWVCLFPSEVCVSAAEYSFEHTGSPKVDFFEATKTNHY